MNDVIQIGVSRQAVSLCDRGHRTNSESVDYTSEGPFGPRFQGGITYVSAIMFDNAVDPNGCARHISLRRECSEGMLATRGV
jgi:hypothetical protein